MNILISKFKELILSVLPITIIVLVLNITIAPIETELIYKFIIGAVFIIFGLSIFLFGADIGIEPIGFLLGSFLTKRKKIWLLVLFGFILGFFITIAEPDLQVLTRQINDVTAGVIPKFGILIVISIGVGLLFAVGLIRILFNISLAKLLTVIYGIIFLLAIFTSQEFLAISFDASGSTTGSMSVPLILAFGLAVSSVRGGRESEEDSFGLSAVASTGPIISVIIMSLLYKSGPITGSLKYDFSANKGILHPFIIELPKMIFEVTIALAPILIMLFLFQIFLLKISKSRFIKLLKGLLYTFIGLILFLTGVNAGFMETGSAIGYSIASIEHSWLIIPIGFIFGLVVVSAEPAVYVLNEQIAEVTSGYIRKKVILYTLSIGVALAVALSMIRIMVPEIMLWHYLLPGYLATIVMSYFVPKIFVGISFDAGGIASGPMTATFILAFTQGAAEAFEGANVLIDAFGIVSLISLVPIIAIQILGLIYKHKTIKVGVGVNERTRE